MKTLFCLKQTILWLSAIMVIFLGCGDENPLPTSPNLQSDALTSQNFFTAPKAAGKLFVPFFSQRDSRWANNQLGTCKGTTIGSAGCAITSIAMVFGYYCVNVDAARLNNWLTQNSGYADGCLVKWDKAVGYTGGLVKWIGKYGTDYNLLNQHIDAGRPVIVQVSRNGIMHFVVVTGRSGNTYYINDPWDLPQNPNKTLGSYSSMYVYGYKF